MLQPALALCPALAAAGGGAIVETGTKEFAGELHHEQPLVYNNGTAVIILYGFLSNLEELFKWIESDKVAGSYSTSKGLGGSLSSRRLQRQSHAAEALLEVYSQTGRRDHLIMLSELQVCSLTCPPLLRLHEQDAELQSASVLGLSCYYIYNTTCAVTYRDSTLLLSTTAARSKPLQQGIQEGSSHCSSA